jgi:hypothetical protein
VKNLRRIVFLALTLLLIVYAAPSFNGNFIYKNVKNEIPKDYFELFSFMNTRPQGERVMNLSQGWNWGWTLYNWGYTGSGFLWYGMAQPILDRAFDVWSPYNENYYWEVERALFSKDFAKVDSLLEKYQIEWVVYDPTVISYPGERQPIYSEAIAQYLQNGHNFRLEKDFGKVKLYKVLLKNKPQNEILEYQSLQNVLPNYTWTSNDEAAALTDVYYSDLSKTADVYFPFRSIFSSRRVGESEFNITKNEDSLTLSNPIPKDLLGKTFSQNYSDSFVAARVKVEKIDGNSFKVSVDYLFPSLGNEENKEEEWIVDIPNPGNLSLNINSDFFALTSYGQFIPFDKVINLSATKNNVFNFLNDESTPSTKNLEPPLLPTEDAKVDSTTAKIEIPFTSGYLGYNSFDDVNFFNHKDHDCAKPLSGDQKISREGNATAILFDTQNEVKRCFDVILDNLSQATGYIIEVQSKHIAGEPLQLALVSQQPKKTEFQISLPKDNKFQYSYVIIPAMQRDGLGYSLHFENASTVAGETVNELRSVRLTPIPYWYLTSLRIGSPSFASPIDGSYSVKKIFPAVYRFDAKKEAKYVVLSQAYDKGWVAFGPVGKHILINNWENGWEVKKAGRVYIVFVPEAIVIVGMALSIFTIFLILKKRIYAL